MGTLYEVLQVQRSSSAEDIKLGYRRLMLRIHPDKAYDAYDKELVHRAQLAWETLRDADRRLQYDSRLASQELALRSCVYDEVALGDFEVRQEEDPAGGGLLYSLGCRCGGEFSLAQADLESGFNLIQCSHCSAHTLIRP